MKSRLRVGAGQRGLSRVHGLTRSRYREALKHAGPINLRKRLPAYEAFLGWFDCRRLAWVYLEGLSKRCADMMTRHPPEGPEASRYEPQRKEPQLSAAQTIDGSHRTP